VGTEFGNNPSNNNDGDSIFDSLSHEADNLLSKGMLDKLISESQETIGNFGDELNSKTLTTAEKLSNIQSLEQIALAEAVKSFNHETFSEMKTIASQRLLKIASTIKSTINMKHNLEASEVIDFRDPKFSMAFGFLLELVVKTLTENDVSEDTLLRVMDSLSLSTTGFEDKLTDAFHKVPLANVPHVKNPFINDVEVKEVEYINLYADEQEDVIDVEEETEEEPKPKKKRARRKRRRKKPAKKEDLDVS